MAETNSTRIRSGVSVGAGPRSLAGGDQLRQGAPVPGVGEEEVDEARAGDLDPVEAAGGAQIALQLGLQPLGDGARVVAQRRRQQHRGVGAVVAQLRLRRAVERGRRLGPLAVAQGPRRVLDGAAQLGDRIGGGHRSIVWTEAGAGYAGRLRVAVLSDVHSNQPALEAVLAAIDEAGVDELWCLGDVVGYGAQPDACAELIRERCDVCLVGNHDLAVLGGARHLLLLGDRRGGGRVDAASRPAEETLEFLRGLEPAGSREGVGLFHASPRDPIWEYVLSIDQAEAGLDAQEERVALIGHSHISLFFSRPDEARAGETQGAQAGDGALLEPRERRAGC